MSSDSAKVSKVLFTTRDLKPINSVCNQAKQVRDKYSLPWNDQGQRMLPCSVYREFNSEMIRLRNDFEVAVRELSADYPRILEDAKIRLNGMFNPDDFPSSIEEKFSFDLDVVPMPKGDQLKITTLSDEENLKMQEEVTRKTMEKMKSSATEVVSRVLDAIMVLLKGTDGKGGLTNPDARFHESSITKLKEIVEIAPALNVLDNPDLHNMIDAIKQHIDIDALDVKEVRDNPAVREKLTESSFNAVTAIQDAMGGIL
jgi:hypothetical protein